MVHSKWVNFMVVFMVHSEWVNFMVVFMVHSEWVNFMVHSNHHNGYVSHGSDVKWPSWLLELPVNWVFVKQLVQTDNKETSKVYITVPLLGEPPVTGGFPTQRHSNVENISTWWRHNAGGIFHWKLWSLKVYNEAWTKEIQKEEFQLCATLILKKGRKFKTFFSWNKFSKTRANQWQLSAVITWSNITRYFIKYCSDSGIT